MALVLLLKRHVWNLVRSKRIRVRNAETFASECAGLKTNVICAPVENINAHRSELDMVWKDVHTVKRTQKIHHIIAEHPYNIICKLFPSHNVEMQVSMCPDTGNKEFDIEPGSEDETETLSVEATEETASSEMEVSTQTAVVGSWVAVVYEDKWMPGTIEEVYLNGKVLVKFMKVIGPNCFIWPEKTDSDVIDYNSVLTKLTMSPNLISSGRGGIYSLDASEFRRILDLFISIM